MSKLILHLDDEPNIREVLRTFLVDQGYRVISAATPAEAIAATTTDRPDLFISDLQLEDGDGLETIAELRKVRPDLPVMMLTGVLIDRTVARKTIASHVNAYLEKTTPLTRIGEEIRRILGE